MWTQSRAPSSIGTCSTSDDDESTLALGASSFSSIDTAEYDCLDMNEKVDLISTLLDTKPPKLPLREERLSLGVECVYKAKGVGWDGVKKKSKVKKKTQDFVQNKVSRNTDNRSSWNCAAGLFSFDEWFKEYDYLRDELGFEERSKKSEVRQLRALSYREYVDVLRNTVQKKKRCYLNNRVPDEMNVDGIEIAYKADTFHSVPSILDDHNSTDDNDQCVEITRSAFEKPHQINPDDMDVDGIEIVSKDYTFHSATSILDDDNSTDDNDQCVKMTTSRFEKHQSIDELLFNNTKTFSLAPTVYDQDNSPACTGNETSTMKRDGFYVCGDENCPISVVAQSQDNRPINPKLIDHAHSNTVSKSFNPNVISSSRNKFEHGKEDIDHVQSKTISTSFDFNAITNSRNKFEHGKEDIDHAQSKTVSKSFDLNVITSSRNKSEHEKEEVDLTEDKESIIRSNLLNSGIATHQINEVSCSNTNSLVQTINETSMMKRDNLHPCRDHGANHCQKSVRSNVEASASVINEVDCLLFENTRASFSPSLPSSSQDIIKKLQNLNVMDITFGEKQLDINQSIEADDMLSTRFHEHEVNSVDQEEQLVGYEDVHMLKRALQNLKDSDDFCIESCKEDMQLIDSQEVKMIERALLNLKHADVSCTEIEECSRGTIFPAHKICVDIPNGKVESNKLSLSTLEKMTIDEEQLLSSRNNQSRNSHDDMFSCAQSYRDKESRNGPNDKDIERNVTQEISKPVPPQLSTDHYSVINAPPSVNTLYFSTASSPSSYNTSAFTFLHEFSPKDNCRKKLEFSTSQELFEEADLIKSIHVQPNSTISTVTCSSLFSARSGISVPRTKNEIYVTPASSPSATSVQNSAKDMHAPETDSSNLQITCESSHHHSITMEDCDSRSDDSSFDTLRFASQSKIQLEALEQDLDEHCQAIKTDLAAYNLPIIARRSPSEEVPTEIHTSTLTLDMGIETDHIDRLISEVNGLCQKIEEKIDNIVNDTEV